MQQNIDGERPITCFMACNPHMYNAINNSQALTRVLQDHLFSARVASTHLHQLLRCTSSKRTSLLSSVPRPSHCSLYARGTENRRSLRKSLAVVPARPCCFVTRAPASLPRRQLNSLWLVWVSSSQWLCWSVVWLCRPLAAQVSPRSLVVLSLAALPAQLCSNAWRNNTPALSLR